MCEYVWICVDGEQMEECGRGCFGTGRISCVTEGTSMYIHVRWLDSSSLRGSVGMITSQNLQLFCQQKVLPAGQPEGSWDLVRCHKLRRRVRPIDPSPRLNPGGLITTIHQIHHTKATIQGPAQLGFEDRCPGHRFPRKPSARNRKRRPPGIQRGSRK